MVLGKGRSFFGARSWGRKMLYYNSTHSDIGLAAFM